MCDLYLRRTRSGLTLMKAIIAARYCRSPECGCVWGVGGWVQEEEVLAV